MAAHIVVEVNVNVWSTPQPLVKTECNIVFSKLLVHRRNQPRPIADFDNAAPALADTVGLESAQKNGEPVQVEPEQRRQLKRMGPKRSFRYFTREKNKARGSAGSFNRLIWVMKR